MGMMTSSESPVTTAAGTSASRPRERSIDRIVSSLGRAMKCTSRPSRTGRAASARACSITSPAIIAVGGLSASAQRPSFSMRIGTGSYRARSRCATTDAAEASETSCSPERPPYSTPTRSRFIGVRITGDRRQNTGVPMFGFEVTHTDGPARRGVLTTPHGVVQTPCFMAVGTRGAVKGITRRDLEDAGAEIILGNTYHLHLRPGDDLIARAGGLHRFINWPHPILTDSGGYQVFSLAAMRKVTEEGVQFRSHLDGASCALSPEKAADIQAQLGSDIAMVLDEVVPGTAVASRGSTPRGAMERSVRWARRARARWTQLREDPGSAPQVIVTNPGQAQ